MMLSIADARSLMDGDTSRLYAAIRSGQLSPGCLTHVAEEMGQRGCPGADAVLFELLAAKDPIVREGAIYGLSYWCRSDTNARARLLAKLREMASGDPSPGVRSAAQDDLEMLEES
jgi:hypothetical protein